MQEVSLNKTEKQMCGWKQTERAHTVQDMGPTKSCNKQCSRNGVRTTNKNNVQESGVLGSGAYGGRQGLSAGARTTLQLLMN